MEQKKVNAHEENILWWVKEYKNIYRNSSAEFMVSMAMRLREYLCVFYIYKKWCEMEKKNKIKYTNV